MSGEETFVVFSNTAINNSLAYCPYMLGYWVGSTITQNAYAIIAIMRLFGVALFCAAAFQSIKIAPFGKWMFLFVLLLPNTLASVSTVTADAMPVSSRAFTAFAFNSHCLVEEQCCPKGQCDRKWLCPNEEISGWILREQHDAYRCMDDRSDLLDLAAWPA